MKAFLKILRHMNVILAMMFGVFLVLDVYNPMMNFIDNNISRGLLILWCALTLIAATLAWSEEPAPTPRRGRALRGQIVPSNGSSTEGWVR